MTDFKRLLFEAFNKPVSPERPLGCCRVYVAVNPASKEELAAIRKAAKALGKSWDNKSHYGDRNAIYIGYDNCDGMALARGSAVEAALKSAGVNCYRPECGD